MKATETYATSSYTLPSDVQFFNERRGGYEGMNPSMDHGNREAKNNI